MKKSKKEENNNTFHSSDSEFDNNFNDYTDIGDDADETLSNLHEFSEASDDSSSEEEVLPVHSDDLDSNEDDYDSDNLNTDSDNSKNDFNISDSDIDNIDDDLPDPKAWGKQKKVFYNADHINDKIEEDDESAKLEEQEAIAIQKRLIFEIDNADLSLDLLSDVIFEKKESSKEREKIELDLTQINEQEKLKLLTKECPELLIYISDYKRLMLYVVDELLPFIKLSKTKKLSNSEVGKFINVFNQLINNYCTNVIFYVILKCRRTYTKSHPISKWLSYYQNILRKAESLYLKKFKPLIEKMLNGDFSLTQATNEKSRKNILNEKVSIKLKSDQNKMNEIDCKMEEEFDGSELSVEDNLQHGIKRPITYQIAKNKGLTPYRKKELRNPRIKHRIKYRKAKIQRKGQIREVRKELQKYSGEISGIKAGIVKSIKFKK
ncbi:hypothetical protein PGB90_000806 [Kerria lacca]